MKTVRMIFLILLFLSYTCCSFGKGPEYIEGKWYYRNENGEIAKSTFVPIDGVSYYFGPDGSLQSDGLIESDGKLYGLEENGALIRNGWKKTAVKGDTEKRWMYFGFDGRAFMDGWLSDAGGKYHFTEGKMDYGWYTDESGNVYYLGNEDDGRAHAGWFAWKGGNVPGSDMHPSGWYYFAEATGRMVKNREMTIGDSVYAFTEDGTEASGFCVIGENGTMQEKYFDPATGKRASGWLYVEADTETEAHPEGWYYFMDGRPVRPGFHTAALSETVGTASVNGAYYAFETGGRMVNGLIRASNGKDYFFGPDGIMQTGLVCVAEENGIGEYLYFEDEGAGPPALGGTVTGIKGSFVYDQGKRLTAENDSFELVTVGTGESARKYIVAADGTIRKYGTLKLQSGKSMRIFFENGSYGWKEQ